MQRINEDRPLIPALMRELCTSPDRVSTTIDECDPMYRYCLEHYAQGDEVDACVDYFRVGARIFEMVRQIMEWHPGVERIQRFLDFAGGAGRVTRFLLQALPPERVWICDILPSAVDSATADLGVHGLVSVQAPDLFESHEPFDWILASSFFSHLPEPDFRGWLRALYDRLNPDGVLAVSVHDMTLLDDAKANSGKPFVFRPERLNDSSDARWGDCFVDESFMVKAIRDLGNCQVERIPAGLNLHQDVYVVIKEPRRFLSRPHFVYPPLGAVDRFSRNSNEEFGVEGWAFDPRNADSDAVDVSVIVNGTRVAGCLPDRERADVADYFNNPKAATSGFACTIEDRFLRDADFVLVKVTNRVGQSNVILAKDAADLRSFLGV